MHLQAFPSLAVSTVVLAFTILASCAFHRFVGRA
ncbi:putative membrane protein [Xanthomonas translucens pv. phlei]|uniref:Putative membrane protein n=1 Tax=Xanthomonas graminis pv. phlei TaxID=487906 RepID=A0A0K2ZY23_9XANT|nr:putative membrane protein [Xanthomonas translucens pv. phlei]